MTENARPRGRAFLFVALALRCGISIDRLGRKGKPCGQFA